MCARPLSFIDGWIKINEWRVVMQKINDFSLADAENHSLMSEPRAELRERLWLSFFWGQVYMHALMPIMDISLDPNGVQL